jgi:hypothetical protein
MEMQEMEMIVWLVGGSWDYEGMHDDSVRVFSSRERADAYAEGLRAEGSYDEVDVWEQSLG